MKNFSKAPKKNYDTNKTDAYNIEDNWSLDVLGLNDYGPETNRGSTYVLVVIDNFSNFGFTVPLKNKNARTITKLFEKTIIESKKTKFNRK